MPRGRGGEAAACCIAVVLRKLKVGHADHDEPVRDPHGPRVVLPVVSAADDGAEDGIRLNLRPGRSLALENRVLEVFT